VPEWVGPELHDEVDTLTFYDSNTYNPKPALECTACGWRREITHGNDDPETHTVYDCWSAQLVELRRIKDWVLEQLNEHERENYHHSRNNWS